MVNRKWIPSSWQEGKIVMQIPKYDSLEELSLVKEELKNSKPLLEYSQIKKLRDELASLESNNGFIIQGGECAEGFDNFSADYVKKIVSILNDMGNILSKNAGRKATLIGRIAGQFAKPRSQEYENMAGRKILTYRGDMVNNIACDEASRNPDARRMLAAYCQSNGILKHIQDSIYSSHEALLLHYEESLVRYNSENIPYLSSTQLPWLGMRTFGTNSAHVEFLRGICNPIGLKCSIKTTADELRKVIEILNPNNENGKIILVSRMGVGNSSEYLDPLIKMVKDNRLNVLWICDPMHGNTHSANLPNKIRYCDEIIKEFREFCNVCRMNNAYIGGIHLEITGEDVLECLADKNDGLKQDYRSLCDPRLNSAQSIWLLEQISLDL